MTSPPSGEGLRPLGLQVVAAVATFYAMSGSLIAATLLLRGGGRPLPLLIASALLAASAGTAALSTWRRERRAPVWLVLCGLCGAALCLLLPASLEPGAGGSLGGVWRSAIMAAVLFVLFMGLLAGYVRSLARAADRR